MPWICTISVHLQNLKCKQITQHTDVLKKTTLP